jgi:hypothetical protein
MAEAHEETIQKQAENEPKSLLSKITSAILVPVFTGVIGLGVGLETNYFQAYFQAEENMKVWEIQHDAEIKTTLLSKRVELLNSFQENITRYFEFDVETTAENNAQVFKLALKSIVPNYKFNNIFSIPSFATTDQMKEHKDIWSSLEKLTESIDVYFGDKIGNEVADLLKALSAEPNHLLDLYAAANYVKKLKDTNAITPNNIATFLKPYISPVPHSADVNRSLNGLIADMKCVIKKSIKIEAELSSSSCQQTPFQNNADPAGAAITILPDPAAITILPRQSH